MEFSEFGKDQDTLVQNNFLHIKSLGQLLPLWCQGICTVVFWDQLPCLALHAMEEGRQAQIFCLQINCMEKHKFWLTMHFKRIIKLVMIQAQHHTMYYK